MRPEPKTRLIFLHACALVGVVTQQAKRLLVKNAERTFGFVSRFPITFLCSFLTELFYSCSPAKSHVTESEPARHLNRTEPPTGLAR